MRIKRVDLTRFNKTNCELVALFNQFSTSVNKFSLPDFEATQPSAELLAKCTSLRFCEVFRQNLLESVCRHAVNLTKPGTELPTPAGTQAELS